MKLPNGQLIPQIRSLLSSVQDHENCPLILNPTTICRKYFTVKKQAYMNAVEIEIQISIEDMQQKHKIGGLVLAYYNSFLSGQQATTQIGNCSKGNLQATTVVYTSQHYTQYQPYTYAMLYETVSSPSVLCVGRNIPLVLSDAQISSLPAALQGRSSCATKSIYNYHIEHCF